MKVLENIGIIYEDIEGSNKYLVSIDLNNNIAVCTCPAFLFNRKECKHIRKVKEEINMAVKRGSRKGKKDDTRYFPSSIEGINELFIGGGYSSKLITGIFGLPEIGKSLFCIQEAYYLISKGYKVLFIDTEGSLESQLDTWEPIFMERFGIDDNTVNENLLIEDRYRKLENIMTYLGYKSKVKMKGSKVVIDCDELRDERKKYNYEFEKDVEKNKIDFIIFDGLSNPIRLAFPSDIQNNPAKSFAEGKIIEKLSEMQDRYKIGCLMTLQASFNPANPYNNDVHLRGGLSVRYNVKRILSITKREKRGLEDIRQVWMVRGETGKPMSNMKFMKYTDLGILDLDAEKEGLQVEDLLTKSQLKSLYGVTEEQVEEPVEELEE